MDRFKFRAWDKEENGMSKPFTINELALTTAIPKYVIDNYIIMQYTGLKDSAGVEIYEGDILRWVSIVYPITVNEFHGYRFMYGKDELSKSYAEYGIIIGNIYENPELLEANK